MIKNEKVSTYVSNIFKTISNRVIICYYESAFNKVIMKKIFKLGCLLLSSLAIPSCGSNQDNNKNNIDMSRYPNFIENVNDISYSFGSKEIQDPFWKGNVIYNESVLMFQNEGTDEISGNLIYKPTKIISVRDYSLKISYKENVDYKLEGNKIILLNKEINYRTKTQVSGGEVPEGFVLKDSISNQLTDLVNMGGCVYTESSFYYGSQLWVTYAYDINELDKDYDIYPQYNLEKLPKIKQKLENKESIKIVALGDSVLEGCSSSKLFKHEPYLDTFIELTRQGLVRLYGYDDKDIILDNQSVGGMMSSWGAQDAQINNVINAEPDLFFLHFGINDLGSKRSTMSFYEDIESIILRVKAALPNCSIVIMSPFNPQPDLYDYEKMKDYFSIVKDELVDNQEDTYLLDIFKLSNDISKNKKYLDMSANGINHVNDFASRVYTNAILSTFYKY